MGSAAASSPRAVSVPELLRRDLGPREEVLSTVPARLVSRPDAAKGLPCVATLTGERLVLVPGASGSPRVRTARTSDPLGELLSDVMDTVGTTVLEVLLGRRGRGEEGLLASRARPGIEVPLGLVRSAFVSRVPRVLGLEIALPPRDARPPFALFVDLGDAADVERFVDRIEGHRTHAPPRPEIERPYALYYLLRELPKPVVRLHVQERRRRGVLRIGLEGPVIGGTQREMVAPYESIERVQWASPTPTRRAAMVVTAGEREHVLEPARHRDVAPLYDVAHLVAELSGRPVEPTAGHVRGGRIAVGAAAAGGAAAALWELLFGF